MQCSYSWEVEERIDKGMLEDGGRRWIVCGALACQRVRIERIGAKRLVSYRHMYIRDIDKERACPRPLVVAWQDGLQPPGRGTLRSPCPRTDAEV